MKRELKNSDIVMGAVATTNLNQNRLVRSLSIRVKNVIEELDTIVALLDLLSRKRK